MLVSLAIRDVVLIDRLDLTFESGLCVLTGETGAGKSILLDSLGLAIGGRADQRLIRPGAERASVTAAFEIGTGHPAAVILAEQDLAPEEDLLVLRRSLGADGRSRAFVNDQPISVGLLRRLGDSLIEVQGQFDSRGLLDPATHRSLLDAFAGLEGTAADTAARWFAWRDAEAVCVQARQDLEQARAEEELLRHDLAELEALDPQAEEIETLEQERALLRHGEQLLEGMQSAVDELTGGETASGGGAEPALGAARRALERIAGHGAGRIEPMLAALERAAAETGEAVALLEALAADLDLDPARLEQVEERFFAIKDQARKHDVEPEALPELRARLAARLANLDAGSAGLAKLDAARDAAREAYLECAESLSRGRQKAAKKLDRAVAKELPPLKLDKAHFETRLERLAEPDWGPQGCERIAFEVSTNPGSAPGPLGRIASGGELSRFLLALKVVLSGTGSAVTLVFDEVDSAIGGATAHAVGERLARLATERQVLVITHSPQVAARGAHHWRVEKQPVKGASDGRVATRVGQLTDEDRREELARMLSGAVVTDEARAAAERLMGAA